ncbi:hydroxyisourate hydrolase [Streptomyces sp. NPDC088341]|uniref:hydroxyisourate hydrolase n=1 Tax=Streptomyces sp. NPDC088341 TaxID=3154870 RepID=UPI003431511D
MSTTPADPAIDPPADPPTASVSTHILDTGVGRPAGDVAVSLAARSGPGAAWVALGGSRTGADGRCKDLPALPAGTAQVRLDFGTEAYFVGGDRARAVTGGRPGDRPGDRAEARQDALRAPGGGAPFFPEVTITFTVSPGEHYHVPLLLSPFGYSVYRGS